MLVKDIGYIPALKLATDKRGQFLWLTVFSSVGGSLELLTFIQLYKWWHCRVQDSTPELLLEVQVPFCAPCVSCGLGTEHSCTERGQGSLLLRCNGISVAGADLTTCLHGSWFFVFIILLCQILLSENLFAVNSVKTRLWLKTKLWLQCNYLIRYEDIIQKLGISLILLGCVLT